MSASVFKLVPGIQGYAWGKKGSASLAAQIGEKSIPDFQVDEGKTYAELWMGTHPNVPSYLASSSSSSSASSDSASTQTTLASHLEANTSLIGSSVGSAFPDTNDGSLPFLFKVLSIGTALSIQAHPDKKLAERLYEERPEVYKDNNHKPEMAIALTPFLAFLNFLPLPTILLHLLSVPELEPLVPADLVEELSRSLGLPSTRPADPLLFTPTQAAPTAEQKKLLQRVFEAYMTAPEEKVKDVIARLVERYSAQRDIGESEKDLVDLAVMLNEQYPDDVGVLCVFLLNVVQLKEGEAAFLGANMPHAYISGDIIECMATSDNVVRAGLTPKLRDVDTLVQMLTYEAGPGSKQLLKPTAWDGDKGGKSKLYDPPIAEFSVLRVELDKGEKAEHAKVDGPSMVVVTAGKGKLGASGENGKEEDVGKGDVWFVGAGQEVVWSSREEEGLILFRAFVEAPKE